MKGLVQIFTYGCQMNDLDSQKMYSALAGLGYDETSDTEMADVIIFNTCSVRKKAEEKALSNLGRLKFLKKRRPLVTIIVTGCVAQQEGEALMVKMPHIDAVIGTHQLHRLPEIVENVRGSHSQEIQTAFSEFIPSLEIIPDKSFIRPGHRAYINIMQGCDNYCSYCIVPYVRGREISRDWKNVIDEVIIHAQRGVKEIFLLGQNVNSYAGGISFGALLNKIAEVGGITRIRFTTSHPKDVSPELIDCFAGLDKLCSHIHLPFQSGSDKVLKAMNRNYTFDSYIRLVNELRKARPDIAFSADTMVGFSTETDADFKRTLDLIEAVRFDVLYSFKYSPRPGTKAAGIEDDVPLEVKKERLSILQTLQNKITLEINHSRAGQTFEVLVDGPSQKNVSQIFGRTTHNTIVNFEGPLSLVGQEALVKITRGNKNTLTGEIIS
jgi:tRNA-2-methylthio-N6-dimethylallyladenosine synthase